MSAVWKFAAVFALGLLLSGCGGHQSQAVGPAPRPPVSSLAATISPGAFPLVRNAPVDLDAAKRLVVKLRPNDGVTYKSLTGDLGAYPGDLDWWVAHRAPAYKQVILEAPIPQTRHPRGTPALSRSYTVIKASPDAAWTIYKSQAGSG